MAELLTKRELDKLKPKTQKSNLNVKKRKSNRKKTSDEAKKAKKHEADVTSNADLIFGLDNGATRDNCSNSRKFSSRSFL